MFVDLSHAITPGMQTYPGLPVPIIEDHLTREAAEAIYGPGLTFQIGLVTMCTNTGTYLDVPFHRYADGHDLAGLDLARVAEVPAVCLDRRGNTSIDIDAADLADAQRWRRADPYRPFTPLVDGRLLHGPPASQRCVSTSTGRVRCGVRWHRLTQHRLDGDRRPSGSFHPAGRADPDRRAPHRPASPPSEGLHLHGGPTQDRGCRNVHRSGVCDVGRLNGSALFTRRS